MTLDAWGDVKQAHYHTLHVDDSLSVDEAWAEVNEGEERTNTGHGYFATVACWISDPCPFSGEEWVG